MATSIIKNIYKVKKYDELIKIMPIFEMHDIYDQKIDSNINFKLKNKLFFIYDPNCAHCYQLFEKLIRILPDAKNTYVIMLSNCSIDSIKTFVNRFDIDSLQNISYCHCCDTVLYRLFGIYGYPSLYLYDNKCKLINYHIGDLNYKNLESFIK